MLVGYFSATAQDRWVTDDQYAEMQKNFAEFAIAKRRCDGCSILPRMDRGATNRHVDSTRHHCSRRRPSTDHGRDRDDCRAWTVMGCAGASLLEMPLDVMDEW
jgi:hypothetical protein